MATINGLDDNYCAFLLRRVYELENQIIVTRSETKKFDLLWSDYCHLWREINKLTTPFLDEVLTFIKPHSID